MIDIKNVIFNLKQLKKYPNFATEQDYSNFCMNYIFCAQLIKLQKNAQVNVRKHDFNTLLSLMSWVFHNTKHNGLRSGAVSKMCTDYLLDNFEQGRGLTCLMIAVIMQEICMSYGYFCHIIQTKSSNPYYLNSHWVVQVYIPNYKWVMLDPTYNIYCMCEDIPLSILDIRSMLIKNKPYLIVNNGNRDKISENEYRILQMETYFQFDVFKINTYNTFFQERQMRINISPEGFDGKEYRSARYKEEENIFEKKELVILQEQNAIIHYTHNIDFLYMDPCL